MNKILSVLAFAALAVSVASCGDSTYEEHTTYFYPNLNGGMKFYADQTSDTTNVISFDSWTASIENLSGTASTNWLSVSPTTFSTDNKEYIAKMTVTLTPNTEGTNRIGFIRINSHDVVSMPVTQYPFLHVVLPALSQTSTGSYIYADVQTATGGKDSVIVKNYAPNARLLHDATTDAWISAIDTTFAETGVHKIYFTLQPNTTGASRTANIQFTSNGVTTPIQIYQNK